MMRWILVLGLLVGAGCQVILGIEDTALDTCGNGIFEPDEGELCDTAGEDTAACNRDCTAPKCGDGLTNLAAGEMCDDD